MREFNFLLIRITCPFWILLLWLEFLLLPVLTPKLPLLQRTISCVPSLMIFHLTAMSAWQAGDGPTTSGWWNTLFVRDQHICFGAIGYFLSLALFSAELSHTITFISIDNPPIFAYVKQMKGITYRSHSLVRPIWARWQTRNFCLVTMLKLMQIPDSCRRTWNGPLLYRHPFASRMIPNASNLLPPGTLRHYLVIIIVASATQVTDLGARGNKSI